MSIKIVIHTTEDDLEKIRAGELKTEFVQIDTIIYRTKSGDMHEFEVKGVEGVGDRLLKTMVLDRFPEKKFKRGMATMMLAIGEELGTSEDARKNKEIFRLVIRKIREGYTNKELREIINIPEFMEIKRKQNKRTIEIDIINFLPPGALLRRFSDYTLKRMVDDAILNRIRTHIEVSGVDESWVI